MPVNRYYSSAAVPTTLAGNISAGATTLSVASPTGYPGTFPFTAAIGYGTATEELVDVTAATGGTWTVTRGVDGTSAQSHSLGEAVQHTTSARDFADYQNHQAATAAVHGVTGSVVGTSDAQTLTNKTLTAPAVAAGALSGTFTGNPTFSGAPVLSGAAVLSGTPNISNGAALAGTFTGSPTLSGDLVLSGSPSFTGAPVFSTTAGVLSQRAVSTGAAWRTLVTGDSVDRLAVDADGRHHWGPGNAAADTVLYRNSVQELKTDNGFTVGGGMSVAGGLTVGANISAANMNLGAWTAWTPAWSTVTGLHTPSFGNATVTGTYVKLGRTVIFSLGVVFGSSTNFGASATTADNWSFTLPGALTSSAAFAGTQAVCGSGRATLDATHTSPFVLRVTGDGLALFMDISGGQQGGGVPGNQGTVDSLTPFTWASGSVIQFHGAVEVTS